MAEKTPDGASDTVFSTRELRGELSEAIMRAHYGKEHLVVTHHGRKYAALIPFEQLEMLEKLLGAEKPETETDNTSEDYANAS